jgi:hypothetical protein
MTTTNRLADAILDYHTATALLSMAESRYAARPTFLRRLQVASARGRAIIAGQLLIVASLAAALA